MKEYYLIYVEGSNSPTKFYDNFEMAEKDAITLAQKGKSTTFVLKAVCKFEITEVVKKTDLVYNQKE